MIQDKLENQILNAMMDASREPKVIVMHPKTWEDLVEEIIGKDGMDINRCDHNLNYRGIKVFRSLDLLEGEFEV